MVGTVACDVVLAGSGAESDEIEAESARVAFAAQLTFLCGLIQVKHTEAVLILYWCVCLCINLSPYRFCCMCCVVEGCVGGCLSRWSVDTLWQLLSM